jgi:hypothetical protein
MRFEWLKISKSASTAPVTVEIKSGRRTTLSYPFSPLLRYQHEACVTEPEFSLQSRHKRFRPQGPRPAVARAPSR